MTSSMASLRGEGVCPCIPRDGGAGEGPREVNTGYLSFVDGVGEGVARGGGALYAIRCGGGGGGAGDDTISSGELGYCCCCCSDP